LDLIKAECDRLKTLILAHCMDNLSLASNNDDIQSSIHRGEVVVETKYQVPTKIEDETNQQVEE